MSHAVHFRCVDMGDGDCEYYGMQLDWLTRRTGPFEEFRVEDRGQKKFTEMKE